MSRCNKSHYAWLAFISKKPRSGYDIKKILEQTSRWYGAESNAHMYPLLKKMEQMGCVTSKVSQFSGARNRRIYIQYMQAPPSYLGGANKGNGCNI